MSLHLRGAGDIARAARHAEDAADRASQALAFDRAARLYRIALEPSGLSPSAAGLLRQKLAAALANAGRNREAAEAYLAAAAVAERTKAIELRRHAAEQFLRGGHANEGLEVVRSVLAALGLRLPATRRRALARLLFTRLRIRLRGLGFRPRTEAELSVDERTRIDACWAVTFCLGFVDHVMAGYLQAQHLLWALAAGEPYRVALALSAEAAYSSPGGGRTAAVSARHLESARRLAETVDRPHSTGIVLLTAGLRASLLGEWKASAANGAAAERVFRERCTGVTHERANAVYWRLFAQAQLGQIRTLRGEVPLILKDAHERGDLYLSTNVRLRVGFLLPLAEDAPADAFGELDRAMKAWTFGGISHQHSWDLLGRVQAFLYRGEGRRAWDTYEARQGELRTALTTRVQMMRILFAHAQGRAAIAAALEGDALRVRAAWGAARRLRREKQPWGTALADLVEAGAASCEGRVDEAAQHLRSALAGLEAAEMHLLAAAARRALGVVTGGEGGGALVTAADQWMAGEAVRNPARLAAMLAPGRWDVQTSRF